ncbi:MAG: methyltransferase domain-containing protein [Proteobacteria bacterium]|nr:methyltransferase domain-containing protein [Pseudomonadota bacterium]MBI3499477.1 methyltransferase domain-containing protein [Pseudomonadota bacterium]
MTTLRAPGEPASGALVFDRKAVRRHRERAASGLERHDFLLSEIAERLADRLSDINRRFPIAVDLGCHTGTLGRILAGRGGVERLIEVDLAFAMARRAGSLAVVGDEEALPFASGSLDAVFSVLSLHWVNDLPGALIQVRRALKPDGLFLAALLGGETLTELRHCLIEAELAEEQGASPRVSPFADLRDGAGLLQRAGFALPVGDGDRLTVTYADALTLMRELRGMGESNATSERRRHCSRRRTMLAAAAAYQQRFALADGRIPATFEVIYLTGWAPAANQQQPLQPGSAEVRLATALGTTEASAGDKAKPR